MNINPRQEEELVISMQNQYWNEPFSSTMDGRPFESGRAAFEDLLSKYKPEDRKTFLNDSTEIYYPDLHKQPTLLEMAAMNGNAEAVDILIENGADPVRQPDVLHLALQGYEKMRENFPEESKEAFGDTLKTLTRHGATAALLSKEEKELLSELTKPQGKLKNKKHAEAESAPEEPMVASAATETIEIEDVPQTQAGHSASPARAVESPPVAVAETENPTSPASLNDRMHMLAKGGDDVANDLNALYAQMSVGERTAMQQLAASMHDAGQGAAYASATPGGRGRGAATEVV